MGSAHTSHLATAHCISASCVRTSHALQWFSWGWKKNWILNFWIENWWICKLYRVFRLFYKRWLRGLKRIFSGFSSWFVQKFRHKTLRQFDVQNYFFLFHYTLVSWLQLEGFTPSSNREDTVYYTEMASSMAPMAMQVVELSNEGYKIRKIFA